MFAPLCGVTELSVIFALVFVKPLSNAPIVWTSWPRFFLSAATARAYLILFMFCTIIPFTFIRTPPRWTGCGMPDKKLRAGLYFCYNCTIAAQMMYMGLTDHNFREIAPAVGMFRQIPLLPGRIPLLPALHSAVFVHDVPGLKEILPGTCLAIKG